jgi:PAS domain S-box-containing protein
MKPSVDARSFAFSDFAAIALVLLLALCVLWIDSRFPHLQKAGSVVPVAATLAIGALAYGLLRARRRERRLLAAAEARERSLRHITENVPVSIVHYDIDEKCLYANRRYAQRYGFTQESILGRHVSDIVGEPIHAQTGRFRGRVLAGETVRFERPHRNLDGAERWIEVTLAPEMAPGGKVIGHFGLHLDITERKRTEEALSGRERELRLVAENIPALVARIDRDGTIQYANQRYARALGVDHASIVGRTLRDVLGGRMHETNRPQREQVLAGKEMRFERRHTLPGGIEAILDVMLTPRFTALGSVEGYFLLAIDITARSRAERLVVLEHEVARVLAGADDARSGIMAVLRLICESEGWDCGRQFAIDENTGVMRMRNAWGIRDDAVSRYIEESGRLEFSPGTGLVGLAWQSGVPLWSDDTGNDPRAHARMLAQATGIRGAFVVPVAIEGRAIGVLSFSSRQVREPEPMLLDTMRAIGSQVGVFLGRMEAEAVLLRLNAELESRVEERTMQLRIANQDLESFSYTVSHDLRAPLRAIDGFGTLLATEHAGNLDPAAQDYIRRMREGALSMAQLIDDLLKLAQVARRDIRRTTVSLSEIADSIVAELRQGQPDRSAIILIAPGLVVDADPNLIRIAMRNLLENAWKFTGRTGAARIEFGTDSRPEVQAFFVRDNGAGFDMAYVEKLFQPFQRLHRKDEFEGTGIGLATVRRIVQRHGGRVWADSAIGQGTTIYFSL